MVVSGERSCIGMRRTVSGAKKSNGSGTSIKRAGQSKTNFVMCISNSGYPASLELHKVYRAIADGTARRDGYVRVVDESGEDYLYPAKWFIAVSLPPKARNSLLRSSARAARRGR